MSRLRPPTPEAGAASERQAVSLGTTRGLEAGTREREAETARRLHPATVGRLSARTAPRTRRRAAMAFSHMGFAYSSHLSTASLVQSRAETRPQSEVETQPSAHRARRIKFADGLVGDPLPDREANELANHVRRHLPPRAVFPTVGTATEVVSRHLRWGFDCSSWEVGYALEPQHDDRTYPSHSDAEAPEMEEWEVEPGRIRDTGAPGNLAVSYTYLSKYPNQPVCEGLEFDVQILPGGVALLLDPQRSTTRVCSVAAGKIRVGIEGEDPFIIGPHGLFKIKPDVKCVAENKLCVDSVLHISTVATTV